MLQQPMQQIQRERERERLREKEREIEIEDRTAGRPSKARPIRQDDEHQVCDGGV